MVETQGMVVEAVEVVATDVVGMVGVVEVDFAVKPEQTANHWVR